MEFNKYQTPIDQLVYKKIDDKTGNFQLISFKDSPEEVQNEFMEALSTVPLIQWLISKDRPLCGELPRDENGKAVWKIEYPPIIENVDYFRQTAIHYENTGKLTDLRPNPNPNSAYSKWKDEEVDRIRNGMLRPDDGAWIPGYMYFYLNYCPIILTEVSESGADIGDRVVGFPSWWEGLLWRFTGWDLARKLGRYFFEISKRGSSKSYGMASGLARGFVIGDRKPDPKHKSFTRGVVLADNKDFLIKDGTLNKFESMIDFLAQNTEFPRKRLKSSLNEMAWTMGYIDLNTGTKKGSGNEVLGVAIKDDPDKARGKRASLFCLEEIGKFPNLATTMKISERSVKDGNIVFGLLVGVGTGGEEGNDFSGALDLIYHPTGSNVLAFENVWDKAAQSRGTSIFCFPAYVNRLGCYNKDGISDVTLALFQICWERYIAKYENPDPMAITRTKAEDPITLQDAIMKRDGTKFPVAQITERIQEIDLNPNFYDKILSGKLIQRSNGEVEFEPTGDKPIHKFPTKDNKIAGAVEIKELPKKNREGRVYAGRYIGGCLKEGELVSTNRGLIPVEKITVFDKLINIEGEEVDIRNTQKYYNTNPVYKVKLWGQYRTTTFSEEHPIYCATPERHYNGIKKVRAEGLPERYYKYSFDFRKVSELKIGDVVKSPNIYRKEKPFLQYWNDISRVDRRIDNPLNEEDFWWFVGLMLGDGWALSSGYTVEVSINNKEKEYLERAKSCIERVFKRGWSVRQGKGCLGIKFCHKYFNSFFRKNFGTSAYNKHIPEWVKYIPEKLKKQLLLGYLSSDGSITNGNAEFVSVSLELLEGIQDIGFSLGLRGGISKLRNKKKAVIVNKESTQQETYHLRYGIMDAKTMSTWGYNYKFNKLKEIKDSKHDTKNVWFSEDLNYIYFKVANIQTEEYIGSIYNFECDTHTFMCCWIPTHNCDPIDDDNANTMSLVSCFILDLWTDEIVAEWTGRLNSAEDCYEVVRLLAKFYNAKIMYEQNKKGIYSYLKMMNSLYLLAETPQFISDKEDSKVEKIGNKKYGINATNPINNYGRDRLKDFMLKPREIVKVVDGQEQTITIPNVMTWWNRALLEEARGWNPDGNFDRISAMGMLMLYREEVLVVNHGEVDKTERTQDVKSHDPFFERNYHPKTWNKPLNRGYGITPKIAEKVDWWGQ